MPNVASALVAGLAAIGVEEAWGVSGGAMAALWHALAAGPLAVRHCRHESGAAFAATEAHFAGGRPVVVFTTTGPGITNALTGLLAARHEGARLILVSAATSAAARGRFAIQETTPASLPAGLFEAGMPFHWAGILQRPDELPRALDALARGVAGHGGFVGHLSLPTALQTEPAPPLDLAALAARAAPAPRPAADAGLVRACARLLSESFAVWLGHGARGAAGEARALLARSGAPWACTPRGRGIGDETAPSFLGVTGVGGHESFGAWMRDAKPQRLLVLGSRLGEASTLFDPRLVPAGGFVHVDHDPRVFGRAYPDAPTVGVEADVAGFLRALLAALDAEPGAAPWPLPPCPAPLPRWPSAARAEPEAASPAGRVDPCALVAALQRHVVDAGVTLLAESGHAFLWATHGLRWREPNRYRASTAVGAMGHAAAGVVGAALGGGAPALALVGDGALMMHDEINTAVKYRAPAVWVVLNDARYGMCEQGMRSLGLSADAAFPEVDFTAVARARGAAALRVDSAAALGPALDAALAHAARERAPFVVDVLVDPGVAAPANGRNRALAGERAAASFPVN